MQSQAIWKYPIYIQDKQVIPMPGKSKILCVQVQNGIACLWVLVDPRNSEMSRCINVAGTGHNLSDRIMGDYVGTFQIEDGALVFHVFDGGEE